MNETFKMIGFGLIGVGVLNQLGYAIWLQLRRDRAEKYHFASKNEPNALRATAYLISASLFFFAFNMVSGFLRTSPKNIQMIAGSFMAFLIAFLIGYGFWAYVKYYYPFILEKRLKTIRFKGMRSSKTGNKLRLLNELEEDEHLTQEMIDMEDNLEADFDVWIDDASKEIVIMKYDITDDAFVCPNCNFRTLKEHSEEVIKEATREDAGTLQKHFRCTYCGHKEEKNVKIPSWNDKHAGMAV